MEPCDLKVETRVAGITFDNPNGTSRQALARLLRGGDRLHLVREPMNPFDPNAIALIVAEGQASGGQIGFIPRALAAVLAPLIDTGVCIDSSVLRVIKVPRHGLWTPPIWAVRIQLDGDLRGLPLPVRTGLEPVLTKATQEDAATQEDDEASGDAPVLGGTRSFV